MTILDGEKYLIESRIQVIINNKKTATGERKIEIAGNTPVLSGDAKKFKALKRMQDIIESGMNQNSKTEYLDLRQELGFAPLSKKIENMLINPKDQVEKEKEEIESGLNHLRVSFFTLSNVHNIPTSDGYKVRDEQQHLEYESLLKMKRIIESNFNTEYSNEYLDLRERTRLGKMEEIQYRIMTGNMQKTKIDDSEIEHQTSHEESQPSPSNPTEKFKAAFTAENINNYINKDKKAYDGINIEPPEIPPEQPLDEPVEEEEELFEVEKITPWKWIKKHKKGILITLGLTALTVTVGLAITQLLPLLEISAKTSNIAKYANQMLANGEMWHQADKIEQFTLHNTNNYLASCLSKLTGTIKTYDNIAGTWKFGGKTLADFAASATAEAMKAAKDVNNLKGVLTATGALGGITTLLGFKSGKKTDEYYTIKKTIDEFGNASINMDMTKRNNTVSSISGTIMNSETLTSRERKILLQKLQRIIKDYKKQQELANSVLIYNSPSTDSIFRSNTMFTDDLFANIPKDEEPLPEDIPYVEGELIEPTSLTTSQSFKEISEKAITVPYRNIK